MHTKMKIEEIFKNKVLVISFCEKMSKVAKNGKSQKLREINVPNDRSH